MKHEIIEEIIEDDTTYRVIVNGKVMLDIKYDDIKNKWIVHSDTAKIKIHEEWDYKKEDKKIVVDKAMMLSYKQLKPIMSNHYRLIDMQSAGLVIILICVTLNIFNLFPAINIITSLAMFIISITTLYIMVTEKKWKLLFSYLVYVFLTVIYLRNYFLS